MTPNLRPSPASGSVAPDETVLVNQIKIDGGVPRHVAIIMDGNGRWARARRLPRPAGHKAGMKSVRAVVEASRKVGVEILTLFAFSQENWSRPLDEVVALMGLLKEYIARETAELRANGVRVNVLGDLSRLKKGARAAVDRICRATADGTDLQLNLCISYSARAELTRAAQLIAEDVQRRHIKPEDITEEMVANRLYTAPWGDPDLLIRTSGEYRISNFLLWQLAYTELYVTPVLWPDFGRRNFYEALLDYRQRERRFGRVSV